MTTVLDSSEYKTAIVDSLDCPDTCTSRFDSYCRTALWVRRDLVKKPTSIHLPVARRSGVVMPQCAVLACFLANLQLVSLSTQ